MITQMNDDEDMALQGLPLMAQVLYFRGIRRFMDGATGMVGMRRRISYASLCETLYVEPRPGRKHADKPTVKTVRVCIKNLIEAGLLESRCTERALVFFCPLASSPFQVSKKEGRGRAEEGQTQEGRANASNDEALSGKEGRGRAEAKTQKEGIHQISNINTLSLPPYSPPQQLPATIPEDFAVTDAHRDMAAMMGAPPPESCIDAFIGHHQSRGTLSANWDGELRKWLAREREYRSTRLCREQSKSTRGRGNEKSDRTFGKFAERYGHLAIVES